MHCFECGDSGHFSRDCPNREALAESTADTRPRWCGMCDRRSRHADLADGRVRRCTCHPESHLQMKHHRKCPECQQTVVAWDTSADCEHHILAGQVKPYVGSPAKPEVPDKISEAARQVAESRYYRERAAIDGNSPH